MSNALPIPTTAATPVCPVELRLGRIDWTRADYIAEGLRHYDAGKGFGRRDQYAGTYADLAMPAHKLVAWKAEAKARRDAEFGDAAYWVGVRGMERAA